jgi:hypothetical protein
VSPTEDEVHAIFTAGEDRSARWTTLLRGADDLVAVVLRGHLVFEEILFRVVQTHCVAPEHLAGARLRFVQLIALARSLEKIPAIPETTWQALAELNSLRNALAHSLEPASLEERVGRFVTTARPGARPQGSDSSKEAVSGALHFLLGQLQVLDVFTESVEYLIAHRLQGGA